MKNTNSICWRHKNCHQFLVSGGRNSFYFFDCLLDGKQFTQDDESVFSHISYLIASNAASSAAIRSSAFSIPIDRRIVFGLMPCSSSSSSVHWLCVVVAGWITKDFTSATFASSEKIARLSMNFCAVAASPLISNVKIDPPPLADTSYTDHESAL